MLFDGSAEMIVDSKGLPVAQYFSEENNEFAVETTDGSLILKSDYDFRLTTLIIDNKGFPVPQLWNPETEKFEVKTELNSGTSGRGGSNLAKEFGIVADGITDNTENLQAAINYLHSIDGGTLELPGGVLLIGDITLKSNVNMVGNSRKTTTILIESAVGMVMESETSIKDCIVSGLDSSSFPGENIGVRIIEGEGQNIESCVFLNLSNCIYNQKSLGLKVNKCLFNCNVLSGKGLYSEISDSVVIENCKFFCNSEGVCFIHFSVHAKNSLLKNNTFEGNGIGENGVVFNNFHNGEEGSISNNRIISNHFKGFSGEGICFDISKSDFEYENIRFGGTVSSASSNVNTALTDSSLNLNANSIEGSFLLITSGKGAGQIKKITGNTKTVLSINKPWVTTPDYTSNYIVGSFSFDNILTDNVIESCGRHGILLRGCNLRNNITNNIVKDCGYSEEASKLEWGAIGISSYEGSSVEGFRPSMSNSVSDNVISGCKSGVVVSCDVQEEGNTPILLPSYILVNGNIVQDAETAIWVKEGKDIVIQSNSMQNNVRSVVLSTQTRYVKSLNNMSPVAVSNSGTSNYIN